MRNSSLHLCSVLAASTILAGAACSNGESASSSAGLVEHPDVPGTVFTIVFENEDADNVISPKNPFFAQLAAQYAHPTTYESATHPSLPNYVMMLSGATDGIINDSDPTVNFTVPGKANLADQLDAANVPWRAYMEGMGAPCATETDGMYTAHHNPFVYFWTMRMNTARCEKQIVDFDAHFSEDLASNTYRYMWITPNKCNDMHDCPTQTGDAWLKNVMGQIMSSPGYLNGGAIFILFDEGNSKAPGAEANLPVIVVSPNLKTTPYVTSTPFDHRSYLATVEDIFGLDRLSTTAKVTSMDELFRSATPR